ncbi:MAG: PorP/SprF family type IX secretion system membrane protein [Saprospiraceae bacterium]|nr:PorP/SprF family type IX secretion system membrane protein [Saprospiraceae bacterium]MCF8248441.1 PorP/SprF family type IX secretion system membrane protein [Saprospiraceae bacterium]MCF8281325.1 PorP/SprF family type IX secretion system membrane protein [Bacteroidales bacterium]MCF8309969.1 PorP/SprF family type IX secretion system membrane protein [Saprospiraceae bacterium]MCF8438700.1 PorP/SprF family type IX secretion system membrane protein [Saprospiraceae bacterium]
MKLKITTVFAALGICLQAFAQDPQFVQFYASPLQLNPAMTGVHPGKWRAVVNYREQWSSILDSKPYKSLSASFDAKNQIGRGDYLAYGVTVLRDQAGSSNYLRQSADLSLSYMKELDGSRYSQYEQYLIGGASVGFGQHSLDYGGLWFSSQFNNGTEQIDYSLSNGESINESSGAYMNINAGLLWYAVFDDNKSLYFGGSLNHVNAPKVSFIDADGQESIDMKWVGHAGGELPFSHQFSILPAVAVIGQGENMLALYGANVRYTNRDWNEVALRAGLWGHLAKDVEGGFATPAVTFTAILELERWNLGVSYDIASNKLSPPTNNRGAFELSLIYYHPGERKARVKCPKL